MGDGAGKLYYELLKVKRSCTSEDVSKAWSTIYTSVPRTSPQFPPLKKAYETLIDPVKRQFYDTFGTTESVTHPVDDGFHFSSEFLDNKDVQQVVGKLRRDPLPSLVAVPVTLTDLYLGRAIDVAKETTKPCVQCPKSVRNIPCPECTKIILPPLATCRRCMNTRSISISAICFACNGKKVISFKIKTQVVVKPGTLESERLLCADLATEVALKQAKHPFFVRQGCDLYMPKKITLVQALCGVRFTIEHLDGRTLLVSSPLGNVLYPGCRRVIPKEGMPMAGTNGTKRGDLIIVFQVTFPDKIEKDTAKEIESLLTKRPDFKMPTHPETEEFSLVEFDPKLKFTRPPSHNEAYLDDKPNKDNPLFKTGERCTHQ